MSRTPPAAPPDPITEAMADPGRAEVFAHFGLAIGVAQLVEQHLGTVLGLLGVPEPYVHEVLVDIIERARRKTMGQLARELEAAGVAVIGADELKAAVDERNFIAHHFFVDPERSVKMTTESGRRELIAELDDAARQFHLAMKHLRSAEVSLAADHGVSRGDVMGRLRELRAGAVPGGSLAERAAYLVNHSPHEPAAGAGPDPGGGG